jgi:hypothetical protein
MDEESGRASSRRALPVRPSTSCPQALLALLCFVLFKMTKVDTFIPMTATVEEADAN